jgi:hypothetical protein
MSQRIMLLVFLGVALCGLLGLFVSTAYASGKLGGESCQCFYTNQCRYENKGFGEFVGYNYHLCRGSCAPYGRGWAQDDRCMYPAQEP